MYQNPISSLHNSSLPSVSETRYCGHRHGYSDSPQTLPLPIALAIPHWLANTGLCELWKWALNIPRMYSDSLCCAGFHLPFLWVISCIFLTLPFKTSTWYSSFPLPHPVSHS